MKGEEKEFLQILKRGWEVAGDYDCEGGEGGNILSKSQGASAARITREHGFLLCPGSQSDLDRASLK